MRTFLLASFAALAFSAAACNHDGSCQSGPKYGTQCYNANNQNTYTSGGSPSSSNTTPQSTPASPMPTTPAR